MITYLYFTPGQVVLIIAFWRVYAVLVINVVLKVSSIPTERPLVDQLVV